MTLQDGIAFAFIIAVVGFFAWVVWKSRQGGSGGESKKK